MKQIAEVSKVNYNWRKKKGIKKRTVQKADGKSTVLNQIL
jgi:hypothetical protein